MRALIVSFLLIATAARADDIKATYQATLESVATNPDCKRKEYTDFTSYDCTQSKSPAVWYFTKPGSPAHPGVMERHLSAENGATYMDTDAHSYGSDEAQPAFKAWMDGVGRSVGH